MKVLKEYKSSLYNAYFIEAYNISDILDNCTYSDFSYYVGKGGLYLTADHDSELKYDFCKVNFISYSQLIAFNGNTTLLSNEYRINKSEHLEYEMLPMFIREDTDFKEVFDSVEFEYNEPYKQVLLIIELLSKVELEKVNINSNKTNIINGEYESWKWNTNKSPWIFGKSICNTKLDLDSVKYDTPSPEYNSLSKLVNFKEKLNV